MSKKTKMIVFVVTLLSFAVGSIYSNCNHNKIEEKEKEMRTSKLVYDARRYYYNQLTLEEQILYDNIASSKEKIMKNQEVCIGQMKSSYEEAAEKAKNTLNKVVWAYRLDNPICTIWFDHYKRYLITQNSGDDIATFDIMIRPRDNGYHYFESQKELEEAIQEVETKVEKFVSQLSGTEEEKLRSIHDWILQEI